MQCQVLDLADNHALAHLHGRGSGGIPKLAVDKDFAGGRKWCAYYANSTNHSLFAGHHFALACPRRRRKLLASWQCPFAGRFPGERRRLS